MKNAFSVFKREFKSYFDSPVAYVFLTAFLALLGFLTFVVAVFYERRQADLTPFFFWHPWVYLLLVPAATMGLWADERRNGTAELLLTLPMTAWEALVGKFLAAWAFIALALALTFPVAATAGYLGSPDWGAVVCGYVGSLLLAGAATAIGLFASALSKSSVVGFVASLALVFALLIVGFDPVTGAVAGWGVPAWIVDGVASLSLLTHYESLRRGVLDLADVVYYAGAIAFFVAAAKTVVDGRRGASKGLVGLAAVAVIAVAAGVLVSRAGLRADLTEEKLYTLSDGSKAVLGKLENDVTLKFYFSSSSAETPTALKTYAQEVENLLKEYERAAKGKLVLEKYDPAPDSDDEEWAQKYGVEQQQVTPFGPPVYFGVVAVAGDRTETLGALAQGAQSSLEYDLTRLITRVAWPERPVIGVMTSLDGVLGGGPANPMMGRRPQQGWVAFTELGKDYEVRSVATDAEKIDDDVKTLVLLHAKDLSDKTLYAIDQFVLRGGKLLACTDPMSIREILASQESRMMGMGGDGPSTLGKLFEAWGVGFDANKVTCDLSAATKLGNGRTYEEEPAFLSLGAANMDKSDLLVSRLTQVALPFAGAFTFDAAKNPDLRFTPLIATSKDNSSSIDKMTLMMGAGSSLQSVPDGESRVVAARLDGLFKTAYPNGPDGTNDVSNAASEGRGAVLLFADADFIADDYCVRVMRTPFGSIAQPRGDNLALFAGAIEQLAGREELIGLHKRGESNRPFDVVDRLEADAIRQYQQREEEFQNELNATVANINSMKADTGANGRAIMSREQREELENLNKKAAETRRKLKDVRKSLTAGIDSLGSKVKWLNIVLMPALVVLFGLARGFIRRKRG